LNYRLNLWTKKDKIQLVFSNLLSYFIKSKLNFKESNILMAKISYFTKKLLIKANNESIKSGRNRNIIPAYLETLEKDNKFPVLTMLMHNDIEVRCEVMCLEDSSRNCWLDIPLKAFNKLPTLTVSDDIFDTNKSKLN
tara:strand:- start:299 stop:712 length:414 start_codon:yes stop_codon:yes gene_type:complete